MGKKQLSDESLYFFNRFRHLLSEARKDEKELNIILDAIEYELRDKGGTYYRELFDKVIKIYNNADEQLKSEILKKLISGFFFNLSSVDNMFDKRECELHGHDFSSWKKEETTEKKFKEFSPNMYIGKISLGGTYYEDTEKRITWERTCRRCGEREVLNYEPDEARSERLEQETKARIRVLEDELATLKGEKN